MCSLSMIRRAVAAILCERYYISPTCFIEVRDYFCDPDAELTSAQDRSARCADAIEAIVEVRTFWNNLLLYSRVYRTVSGSQNICQTARDYYSQVLANWAHWKLWTGQLMNHNLNNCQNDTVIGASWVLPVYWFNLVIGPIQLTGFLFSLICVDYLK